MLGANKLYLSIAITIGIVICLLGIPKGQAQQHQHLAIDGTYRLTSRKLADGTIMKPPDVIGLYTYTKSYRNFSLVEKSAQGGMRAVSITATYNLTATQYSETLLAMATSEQGSEQKVTYDVSGKTGTSPVTVDDGQIQFKLPVDPLPVSLRFKGNTLTATGPGFVDTWEKVP